MSLDHLEIVKLPITKLFVMLILFISLFCPGFIIMPVYYIGDFTKLSIFEKCIFSIIISSTIFLILCAILYGLKFFEHKREQGSLIYIILISSGLIAMIMSFILILFKGDYVRISLIFILMMALMKICAKQT